MLDIITSLAGALYAAMTAFALSVQALAPVMPWHASMLLSGLLAGVAAVSAWAAIRVFRRR